MWTQEARDAYRLFMAFAESKLVELLEVVEEFIAEYRFYILIGLIILVILVILDLLMKWQEKREKKKIDEQIEEQMKEKMIDDNSGEGP
jgi:hypothetical protein